MKTRKITTQEKFDELRQVEADEEVIVECERIEQKSVTLKCNHCGHLWNYTGEMLYATCPNCMLKVSVEKCRVMEKKES